MKSQTIGRNIFLIEDEVLFLNHCNAFLRWLIGGWEYSLISWSRQRPQTRFSSLVDAASMSYNSNGWLLGLPHSGRLVSYCWKLIAAFEVSNCNLYLVLIFSFLFTAFKFRHSLIHLRIPIENLEHFPQRDFDFTAIMRRSGRAIEFFE